MIYLFTKGYPNEQPVPFWGIFQNWGEIQKTMETNHVWLVDALVLNSKYWYPNATRFIPFTIHEFPSYSYVVADLHGHVFDIPFVLLTLALLFILFIRMGVPKLHGNKKLGDLLTQKFKKKFKYFSLFVTKLDLRLTDVVLSVLIGFLS